MRAHHFPTGEMHRHSAGMTGHARSPRL
jgi:hypothetical protein